MSESGVSPESARVRWLVAGAFSAAPTGRRFHLSADTFPAELTRAARPRKDSASTAGRPNSFTSSAPATLNRSVIVAFIEALSS